MICGINCLITIIFIIGNIWFNLNIGKDYENERFLDMLNENQRNKYKKIVKERFSIAMKGYALGLFFSLMIILYNYYIKKIKIKNIYLICLVGCVTFLTQYFFYILSPKKRWMLESEMSLVVQKAWLHIYRKNQWHYHFGLLLGLISVFFLSNSFVCKKYI